MKSIFSIFATTCIFCMAFGDTVVWQGKVNSNGTPTRVIKLSLGQKYKVKVSGKINLDKWRTGGKALENDACYEFIGDPNYKEILPKKIDTLKNSLNLNICEGKYQPNHTYESQPFTAKQSGIHFWIYDTDYEDNSGSLDLEVTHVIDTADEKDET